MATGFLANRVCYETQPEAADAYFSGIPVATSISGTTTLANSYFKSGTVWGFQQKATSSTGVITTNFSITAPVPVFPACAAPSEFFYAGVEMGGWLVGVLVIGWAFTALSKSL